MQCSMCAFTHLTWLKKVFGQEEGWSQRCRHGYCRLITQKKFNTKIFYESLPVQTSYKSTLEHRVLLKCPLQDALPCKQPLLSQVPQPGAGAEEQEWNTRHGTLSLCKPTGLRKANQRAEGRTDSNKVWTLPRQAGRELYRSRRVL